MIFQNIQVVSIIYLFTHFIFIYLFIYLFIYRKFYINVFTVHGQPFINSNYFSPNTQFSKIIFHLPITVYYCVVAMSGKV